MKKLLLILLLYILVEGNNIMFIVERVQLN